MKSSCVGVRTTGSQEKVGQHERTVFIRRCSWHSTAGFTTRPPTHRVSPTSVEAALLSFPIIKDRKVPVSPQVLKGPPTRPRLRTHGRLAFAMRRIGYRRTADVTGFLCFARKHEQPLASSGRTRDSIPHGVRSAKVGAKHARYLGTGCSDRGFPISRTASFEHLPPQANASISCSGNSIEDDFARQYSKGAGPKSRRFLAG